MYVRYVLDLAEIPTFQAGRIDAQVYARRIARGARADGEWPPRAVRSRARPRSRIRSAPAACKTTRFEVLLRGPAMTGRSDGRVPRRELRGPDRLEGDRRRFERQAGATSFARIRRISCRARSTSRLSGRALLRDGRSPRPTLTRGASLRAPDRVADSGFAKLVGREQLGFWVIAGVARRSAVLGHGTRTLARAREDDRDGVPRRAARHAAARGAARPDRHRDAHGRRLHARLVTLRPLAVRRAGPPLSRGSTSPRVSSSSRSARRCSPLAGGTPCALARP